MLEGYEASQVRVYHDFDEIKIASIKLPGVKYGDMSKIGLTTCITLDYPRRKVYMTLY